MGTVSSNLVNYAKDVLIKDYFIMKLCSGYCSDSSFMTELNRCKGYFIFCFIVLSCANGSISIVNTMLILLYAICVDKDQMVVYN